MLFRSALENCLQAHSSNQFVQNSPDDHSILGTVLKGEDMGQDQACELFGSILVTEDQESDHDLEVLKHGLMQFFGSSLVLQKQSDDPCDLP